MLLPKGFSIFSKNQKNALEKKDKIWKEWGQTGGNGSEGLNLRLKKSTILLEIEQCIGSTKRSMEVSCGRRRVRREVRTSGE